MVASILNLVVFRHGGEQVIMGIFFLALAICVPPTLLIGQGVKLHQDSQPKEKPKVPPE